MATLNDKQVRFLAYTRVARLALADGERIQVVPMCPAYDDGIVYMATHGKTRKVRALRASRRATLLADQYSEDWNRNVAVMLEGTVEVVDGGKEFAKGKALLEAKYLQYPEFFPIREGESVILRFTPTRVMGWDYAAGEINEPH
jgi:nitroimidazol reductase NimA-like FMN-containing flavoprotein (pyridoxamine 5'-phosphate oxidase superfamily)